jgi:26S proteasome regulatory subunit N12
MEAALQQLESHVSTGNVEAGMALLRQIKVSRLTDPTNPVSDAPYAAALECGVLLSVAAQDLEAFARHYQQLQPLYATTVQTTPRKNHITGLNLMALLVTASSSEFHSELELLAHDQQHDQQLNNDKFLQFPIAVERKLMVGIYDEILTMTLPDPSYQFFMDQLVSTVRDAIADCMEVSYASLTFQQAAEIMKFNTTSTSSSNNNSNEQQVLQDLLDYIETAREDWIVEEHNNVITFQPTVSGAAVTAQDIPSQQWIQQSLTYATEMERIV